MNNLNAARAALEKGDLKGALAFYEMAYNDMPDNLEVEWFYLFCSVTEQVNSETADNYVRLADIFYPTLKYVSTLEEGKEKQSLVYTMIKGFIPLHDIIHDAMINALALDRSAIPMEDVAKVDRAKRIDTKKLADDILDIFGEDAPYCFLASDIWKEMIAERFKWSPYRNFKDKGKELWFDDLAKRIKKYDPDYKLPQFKQAGCLSSGDAAKVTPGS